MPKKPAPTDAWIEYDTGAQVPMLLASAAQAIAWNGSRPTGRWRLRFSFWQELYRELPEAVRPEGDPVPIKFVASEKEAKEHLKAYEAFLRARHPELKRRKSGTLVRFPYAKSRSGYYVEVEPEVASDAPLTEHEDQTTLIQVAGKPALLYWTQYPFKLFMRATDDEVVLLDTMDPADKDKPLPGKAKALGEVSLDGLLVGLFAELAVTDLSKVKSASAKALQELANVGRLEARDRYARGGGFVLPAKGQFTVEAGKGPKMAWLRFRRRLA